MVILMVLLFGVVSALDINDVVFVIISQNNNYNIQLAKHLENSIRTQSETLYNDNPIIHISNKDFPDVAGWTILPLLGSLSDLHKNNASWIFFIQDYTNVRLTDLLKIFEKYDDTKEIWFGDALFDEVATIIHHFAFYEDPTFFKYPNLASGFAVSLPLVQKLADQWSEDKLLSSNFNIDGGYEFSRFVWNDGDGPMLVHENALCSNAFDETPTHQLCVSYPSPIPTCDNLVPQDNIYFAVKTCTKFHKDRVPVVKKTWGIHSSIIKFFSDEEDESIPTIDLGVPNTETGHCMKTMSIIKYIADELQYNDSIKWIVIADDDTILGITNLRRVLSCYDPSEKIGLGERYGYELRDSGYNYITGGGGMVFSKPLLMELAKKCVCPSLTAPDDMYIGICMARMGVEVTHAPGFHQARPPDYNPKFLQTHEAVSFHKHYMIDPIKVYKEWFETSDLSQKNNHKNNQIINRNEL